MGGGETGWFCGAASGKQLEVMFQRAAIMYGDTAAMPAYVGARGLGRRFHQPAPPSHIEECPLQLGDIELPSRLARHAQQNILALLAHMKTLVRKGHPRRRGGSHASARGGGDGLSREGALLSGRPAPGSRGRGHVCRRGTRCLCRGWPTARLIERKLRAMSGAMAAYTDNAVSWQRRCKLSSGTG